MMISKSRTKIESHFAISAASAVLALILVKITLYGASDAVLQKWRLDSYFGFYAALLIVIFPVCTKLWEAWPRWARACSACILGQVLAMVAALCSGIHGQGIEALFRTYEDAGWRMIPLLLGVAFYPMMGWMFSLVAWVLAELGTTLVEKRSS